MSPRPWVEVARWLALTGAVALLSAACTTTPTERAPTQPPTTPARTVTARPQTAAPTVADTPAPADTPAVVDNGRLRPVTITLVISHTNDSDGTYTASGPARFCGNAVMNLTGNPNEFSVEFPQDPGNYEIEDVTFGADDLLPGTTTPSFDLEVTVHAKKGGVPPATIVHPDQPNSGDSGTATRVESGGQTTVTVDGVNDFGDNVHLEAHCGPRS